MQHAKVRKSFGAHNVTCIPTLTFADFQIQIRITTTVPFQSEYIYVAFFERNKKYKEAVRYNNTSLRIYTKNVNVN
jgi:hypothetical protein